MAHLFSLKRRGTQMLSMAAKIQSSTIEGKSFDYDFLTKAEPPKDFEISVLLPLSGDLATAGRAIRDGICMSIKNIAQTWNPSHHNRWIINSKYLHKSGDLQLLSS